MTIQWNKSTCPYCGFGCGLKVGVEHGKIKEIVGLEDHPANNGNTCLLPINLPPIFTHKDRLTRPMIRRDGELVSVGWDEVVSYVATGFKQIIEKHGPDAVAFYGGAINLTEEYYLMNKLMKGAIGTNNVDCSTRLCMASSAIGFASTLGADAPPTCYADIEAADLFFIAGSNMAVSVPVLFNRLSIAKKRNRTRVIVVDPRQTETTALADIHLQIKPGTDVALNNTLAHILLKEGFINEDRVDHYASGLNNLKRHLEAYPPSKGAEITGCPENDIIKGLHSTDIRALWVMTTNPAASLPHTRWVEEGLSKAELLVVQDIFHPTETTALGDVILPAAHWGEKTGTFISAERRIELVEAVIDPPGEAKPDYEIIWTIARAMGFEKAFSFTSPEEVFEEWKNMTRDRICDMNGVSYGRLRGKVGIQLPCPDPDHPGTPRLFSDWRFPRPDGRAALLARDYIEPAETTDDDYPFALITGRLSGQFNTRTRTGRSPQLNVLAPDGFVKIHPKDAERLSIDEGDKVDIISRRGSLHLPVHLSKRLLTGTIFVPWHYGGMLGVGEGKLANLVTNPAYDNHSKQPEYKFTAVKISKIDTIEKGNSYE